MQKCNKISYPTPTVALRAARQIRQSFTAKGRATLPCGVHPCPVCHSWHITSHQVQRKWRI